MRKFMLVLLAMLLLVSAIPAAESTPPAINQPTTPLTDSWESLPDDAEVTVKIGKLRKTLDAQFDKGVQAGVAEASGETAGLKVKMAGIESDLQATARGRGQAEDRAKRAETALVVIGVSAAVLIPAAFIGGALAWGALPR